MDNLWLAPAASSSAPESAIDAAERLAWSTGISLKTMQRDFQRSKPAGDAERTARALLQWSRAPCLGQGARVQLGTTLPELSLVEGANTLMSADLIIDHARRFRRVDGLAERLFVSERWVESVVLAAQRMGARHRTNLTPEDQWWIESSETEYPEHEEFAVQMAMEALRDLKPAALRSHAEAVSPYFVPSNRMVVVEDQATLDSVAALAKALVDDSSVVQLLVPAKLPRRLTPAERERRDALARRKAELIGVPFRPTKERLALDLGIDFDGIQDFIKRAGELGLSVAKHGRTAGARDGPHDWRRASARLCVRIRENGHDRVRSAKVFARVIASTIVACEAEALAKSDADAQSPS